MQSGEGYYMALGTEFTAFQLLSLRAGLRTGQDIGAGIRAGVGFHFSYLDLDYSMSPFGDMGGMHKFGLTMRFGNSKARQPLAGEINRAEKARFIAPKEKVEKLELFARDFLALAQKDIEDRKYTSAMGDMKKAFNLEPSLRNGAWGGREKRLGEIVAGLKLAEIPAREKLFAPGPEQADTAAEAVNAYLEGGNLKALLLAHAAYGANIRGDAMFEELLSLISDLVNIPVRRNEILPKTAMIKEKLEISGKAFYVGDFKSAVHECEEVLLLDHNNKLAWKRLGSAYFALGDTVEAKRAYEKVLKLDPEDSSVLKFIQLQDWK
jgi:tetratricopeptide (TPR) repeat protein